MATPESTAHIPSTKVGRNDAEVGRKPLSEPDAQVTLSLTASLTDPTKRQAVWKVLTELAVGVDDGEASHIQISLKVTGTKKWADGVKTKGADAGDDSHRQ